MQFEDVAFFDLETTGIDPATDRIIEIAVKRGSQSLNRLVNPGRSIPANITALTKITDDMVADADQFKDMAGDVVKVLSAPIIVGFGCHSFDVPLLAEEFERAGVEFAWPPVIDAGSLFKIFEPRDLKSALWHYCRLEHLGAHGAEADVLATAKVFQAQLERYSDLHGLSAEAIASKSRYDKGMVDPAGKLMLVNGVVCYGTHRNRGVPVADDRDYALWMLRSDFPLATKAALRKELERIDAARKAQVPVVIEDDGEPF